MANQPNATVFYFFDLQLKNFNRYEYDCSQIRHVAQIMLISTTCCVL